MFVFLLQVRYHVVEHGPLYLFAIYTAIVWALWLTKVVISRRYRPWLEPFDTSTSVVIPVVDEPLDLFRDVLRRIVRQAPDEVIVVINGARNRDLEAVCEEFAPAVRWTWTPVPGKRNAVRVGTEISTGEITVLVDSDTIWTRGTLTELLKPFREARIGGVTTKQRILEPQRCWITRWADWLENSRALYSMPAQSVLGQVGCLPGRTIAFRRDILVRVMDKFMTERFLGVFLEVSDDRTLTNLTLKEGYRSVYQSTSLVYTDAPTQWKKLFRQQLRWARGSQYNTLRMLPWMLAHAPVLAVFFVVDILLPFLLVGAALGWIRRGYMGTGMDFYGAFLTEHGLQGGLARIVVLAATASVLSMSIRQVRHLAEQPSDFFRLPIFIVVSSLFLVPIRLLGFVRMAHASGWGTRAGAYAGGDQSELLDELDHAGADASPRRVADVLVPAQRESPDGALAPGAGAGTVLTRQRVAVAVTATTPTGRPVTAPRHLNPWAALPYVLALTILALEVLYDV